MTDYKTFFEQAVRTLAAIDDALGIGDDGCSDPSITLSEIHDLKERAKRGEDLARAVMADQAYIESGPAWHDAPNVAGLWLDEGLQDCPNQFTASDIQQFQIDTGTRWFGPISPDTEDAG